MPPPQNHIGEPVSACLWPLLTIFDTWDSPNCYEPQIRFTEDLTIANSCEESNASNKKRNFLNILHLRLFCVFLAEISVNRFVMTSVMPWVKQYGRLREFSVRSFMFSVFKHRWSQLFIFPREQSARTFVFWHPFKISLFSNSQSQKNSKITSKIPSLQSDSILVPRPHRLRSSKRSEKGYGDENGAILD